VGILLTFKGRSFIRHKSKMQLTYVAVVVLASMIFVLSGMVGYVYWQQTRMLQNLQSLAIVLSSHFVRREPPAPEPEAQTEVERAPVQESDADLPALAPIEETKEDDRVSVNEVEVVEGPPATAAAEGVDYESKTALQLRDLLTAKGIPFGKRDAKSVLVQLIKATA
jgi:glucose dehydrogenase